MDVSMNVTNYGYLFLCAILIGLGLTNSWERLQPKILISN